SYTDYWEQKLAESLSSIEGAGAVEVLITLKESEERILEKDVPEESSETIESDAEGGNRTVTERKQEETTVYTFNEAGQNVPYVRKVIQPVVEGVAVIAQGADSEIVKENIIETIQVLFGIDANKIRVVKGKTNNS
ncbi:MAG: stage III sporulation protein AG, partial [Lachnospiraceae bacterium]|nr:stage III sporulation protein AG [Lachnospiraceae bacterium]